MLLTECSKTSIAIKSKIDYVNFEKGILIRIIENIVEVLDIYWEDTVGFKEIDCNLCEIA